jgi:hypothetical protein
LTFESSVAEVMEEPIAAAALGEMLAVVFGHAQEGTAADTGIDMVRMIGSFRIGRFVRSLGGQISRAQLQELFDRANGANGLD